MAFPALVPDNDNYADKVANTNALIGIEDATEAITELLYRWESLLSFTQRAQDEWLLTAEEKTFLDEAFGRFWTFDNDAEAHSLITMRRLTQWILDKVNSNTASFKGILGTTCSEFSEEAIWAALVNCIQSDVAIYAADQWLSSKNIPSIVWETGDLASAIITERGI